MDFKLILAGTDSIPPTTLNSFNMNRVYQYKYLGHYLTEDLKDDADIDRERRALAVHWNMLARKFTGCTD